MQKFTRTAKFEGDEDTKRKIKGRRWERSKRQVFLFEQKLREKAYVFKDKYVGNRKERSLWNNSDVYLVSF